MDTSFSHHHMQIYMSSQVTARPLNELLKALTAIAAVVSDTGLFDSVASTLQQGMYLSSHMCVVWIALQSMQHLDCFACNFFMFACVSLECT